MNRSTWFCRPVPNLPAQAPKDYKGRESFRISKVFLTKVGFEGHPVAVGRVAEAEVGGVEQEPVGRLAAVEAVADDRKAQAGRMGAMDAQLVGAAGVGDEAEEGRSVVAQAEYLVVGDGRLALLGVDLLPGPVIPVGR